MTNTWFHISQTWKKSRLLVKPKATQRQDVFWDKREYDPCICVSPTVTQCIIAIGEWRDYTDHMRIYQTNGRPKACRWIFDFNETGEHRFYEAKQFDFVGEIDVPKLEALCRIDWEHRVLTNELKIIEEHWRQCLK